MNKVVRTLALNDSYHDVEFVTDDWHSYSDACSFMTHRLCTPHSDRYDIKGFALEDHQEIPGVDEDEIIRLFDILIGVINANEEEWHAAFDLLWKYGSEWWHV